MINWSKELGFRLCALINRNYFFRMIKEIVGLGEFRLTDLIHQLGENDTIFLLHLDVNH